MIKGINTPGQTLDSLDSRGKPRGTCLPVGRGKCPSVGGGSFHLTSFDNKKRNPFRGFFFIWFLLMNLKNLKLDKLFVLLSFLRNSSNQMLSNSLSHIWFSSNFPSSFFLTSLVSFKVNSKFCTSFLSAGLLRFDFNRSV